MDNVRANELKRTLHSKKPIIGEHRAGRRRDRREDGPRVQPHSHHAETEPTASVERLHVRLDLTHQPHGIQILLNTRRFHVAKCALVEQSRPQIVDGAVEGMRRGVRESACVLIFLSGRKEVARNGTAISV
eukprot:COSAG02_NODE_9322_length_2256_cov_1.622624_1_plen_131_part_00